MPLPSLRPITVIGPVPSTTPLLSAVMAGSFHAVMAPVKMPHSVLVERLTRLLPPGRSLFLGVKPAGGLNGTVMVVIRIGTWMGAPQWPAETVLKVVMSAAVSGSSLPENETLGKGLVVPEVQPAPVPVP